MLSLRYLLEEAKDLGIPTTKRRAILREYIQTIILHSIYASQRNGSLFFMGGTALRFCYRLPRFSEDLDFNTRKLSFTDFQALASNAVRGLELEGFTVSLDYSKRDTLLTAYLSLPKVMHEYKITDKRGLDLMVKLEVNQPAWKLETKPHVLSLYGYTYTVRVMAESSLITEKLCALLSRNRGRDIYDLLFMLRKKFPFDPRILAANGHIQPPRDLILERLEKLGQKERKRLAAQIQPFLFAETESDLITNAPLYAEKFLEEYQK